ncbi:hypothetical protein [Piscinibacter sp.]|uniref:hypothetical protein n=1 Tax=Piscinibacter sp. TaxID=1903157 RepID=UPI0039E4A899
MSAPVIPTKTALGQLALRRRTGDIGPRHRTILFLVDGRRALAQVLSLAHQAGSATSHFEDLVRMGYVELPPEPPSAAPPPDEAPLESPRPAEITELAVEVGGEVDEAPEREQEQEQEQEQMTPEPAPFLPPEPPPPPPPPPPAEEPPVLQRARAQLLDCLRLDPQPNGARLAEKVRTAPASATLIDVVWTMERGLRHHQRTHDGLIALQRARELLGLGNTLVEEDSTPGRLDEGDW